MNGNTGYKPNGSYGEKEWEAREHHYTTMISSIVIPPNPNPAEVMKIISQIDNVLTESRFDYANFKKIYERYETTFKYEEKALYSQAETQLTSVGQKTTENAIKGYIAAELNNPNSTTSQKYGLNGKQSLLTIVQIAKYRLTFMETMINTLTDKHGSLILMSSMMKLSSGIGSVGTSPTPEQNI